MPSYRIQSHHGLTYIHGLTWFDIFSLNFSDIQSSRFLEYLSMASSKALIRFANHQTRSSLPELLCKKCVLKNFCKLYRKIPVPQSLFNKVAHLCYSPCFNKVAGLRHRCFPENFAKLLRTPFSIEHLRWLLLSIYSD